MSGVRPIAVLAALAGACNATDLVEDDVGTAEYCQNVGVWPTESSELEVELIEAINDARAVKRSCGNVELKPSVPLELVPQLRCAARAHAGDQAENGSLEHEGSGGSSTLERLALAGYTGIPRHEVLAGNFESADLVVEAWLESELHCAAILDKDLAHGGPGHAKTARGDRIVWVLVTGERRP